MLPYRNATFGALVAAAALGLGACGGSEDEQPAATAAQEEQASGDTAAATPEINITSPGDGDEIGSKFTAQVDVGDFKLDPKAVGKQPTKGSGHLHFSLNDGKFDRPKYSGANGKLAVQLGTDGKYSPAVAPQITYEDIPAGEHTLKVVAANNDHSDTGAVSEVTFTVADGKTSAGKNGERVTITGVEKRDGGFTAQVETENFEVDADAVGKQAQANTGHLHFSLDGGKFDKPKYSGANGKLAVQLGTDGKYSPAVEPTITYANLPKGEHTLKVFLANNDHSDTGAVATKTIRVR